MTDPAPGEIWWCDLEPVRGSEANKSRPCVVIGSRAFHQLGLRIVIPLTSWQPHFVHHRNKLRISAALANGLDVDSAADAMQIRSIATDRFHFTTGELSQRDRSELNELLALVLDLDSVTGIAP